ncbi:MAG: SEC-C metal-binding domain-containing protein [Betaproteobacteria bacterium]
MITAPQQPTSRNDPCPCHSGRRFKDCHGSIRGAVAPASASPAPRYEPAGPDWSNIAADARLRLATLMEQALALQRAQRMRDAERCYRAVLEEAPQTHDALHMLGVVRLGLGDFTDAERLIERAMALRPRYDAIERNWSLVERAIAGRDRRGIEIVCEHALPLLADTLAFPSSSGALPPPSGVLHVVGPDPDAPGDAAWAARRIAALLAPMTPTVWRLATTTPQARVGGRLDRHAIDMATGRRPTAGFVVLTHLDGDTDAWLDATVARVLVFMHAERPSTCLERLRRIAADGRRAVTLVFTSAGRARPFGGIARVVPPPIDLDALRRPAASVAPRDAHTLHVLCIGQDRARVVGADDVVFLKAIADRAGRMTLFDPGPLRYDVGAMRSVECVSRAECTLEDAVSGADLYLHRRAPWWQEDDGCALFGAMALGVPVVCPRDSIYADGLIDGENGWLYANDADALAIVHALRADRGRLVRAGAAARESARRTFAAEKLLAAYGGVVERWMRT